MKKKRVLFIFVATLYIILLYSTWGDNNIAQARQSVPKAINGVLDLGDWDFKKDGGIRLSGSWEYYRGQLLTPLDFKKEKPPHPDAYPYLPSTWVRTVGIQGRLPDEGYGTYRLTLRSSKVLQNIALQNSIVISAFKVWTNGQLVLSCGEVGKSNNTHKSHILPQTVSLPASGKNLELIVQVSNFGYEKGGLINSFVLGDAVSISEQKKNLSLYDVFIFASILLMASYHFILFLLRRKDKSTFYFSMVCFLMAIRTLLMGQMLMYNLFPGGPINIFFAVSLATLSLGELFFVLFLQTIFPGCCPPALTRFSLIIYIPYTCIIFLTPNILYSRLAIPYEVLSIIIFVFLIIALLKAVKQKREGAVSVMLAVIVITAFGINDILNQYSIIHTGNFIHVGLFLFLFVQSFMLSRKFSKSFSTVESMSERLIRLDKLKDEFIANTSHELKTPLNGIVGIAQSLLAGAAGELDDAKKHNMRLIEQSGMRLSNLVNDILDFSKLKNNELTINKKSVDIKQIVEVVFSILKSTAQSKSLELVNGIQQEVFFVDGDENRIEQIMFNLVGNAIKFTEIGSVKVLAEVNGNFAVITVKDTGIGIPQDRFEDIFKSFEQLDGSQSRKSEGIGLGLSITKKLVELQGGSIEVRSILGQGSEFSFSLPRISSLKMCETANREQTQHLIYNSANAVPVLKTYSTSTTDIILVVDDDPINLQAMVNCLSIHNYLVVTAVNGREALKHFENGSGKEISLVILDVMMPIMSGYDVCKALRKILTGLELPVLVLTAKNRPEDIQTAFDVGANDFLEKPFDMSEMMARVRSLIALKKMAIYKEDAFKSEIRVLQAQIKPHFLFNSLNVIRSLCRTCPEKAIEVINDLCVYLRGNFSFKSEDEWIEISAELLHVKSYLSLEKARFQERLQIIYDIDDGIETKIPAFMIQPIVENAVKHGLLPRISGGLIHISVKKAGEYINIKVEDNGVGMPQEKIQAIISHSDAKAGIGVKNVDKRLQKLYGQHLQIESILSKGTNVVMKIPIRSR